MKLFWAKGDVSKIARGLDRRAYAADHIDGSFDVCSIPMPMYGVMAFHT